MQAQMILRSEILDALTCDVCVSLDGIMRPADDPAWAGELGMLAHPNCRVMFVPLFEGIPSALEPTPLSEIKDIKQMLGGSLVTTKIMEGMKIPTRGANRFTAHPLTEEDFMEFLEPADVILRLWGVD